MKDDDEVLGRSGAGVRRVTPPLIGDPLHADTLARLRRVYGQLGGVLHMLEQNRSSAEVLTQLAAVTHGLHRAGYRMVAEELERVRADGSAPDRPTAELLEKLFLALG